MPFLTFHFLTIPLRRFCSGPIKGIPQAPGGEGCYRCPNGGYCTAPDTCTCTEGWTGYDCRTPVCERVATPLERRQLMTFDEDKVNAFEKSPCGLIGIWPLRPVPDEFRGAPGEPGGYYASRGNCTAPNECTCWCDLGVPLFRDGFTPSTRLVFMREDGGWFLF